MMKSLLQTPVKYVCPVGKAFDGLYTRIEWGNCSGSGLNAFWKYNSSSPLPDCIGMSVENLLKITFRASAISPDILAIYI